MNPSPACSVQEPAGDFDLAWYAQSGMGVAWLGHHPVAIVNAEGTIAEAPDEIIAALRAFVVRHAGRSDNDTITLTDKGRIEANLIAAQGGAYGSSDPV